MDNNEETVANAGVKEDSVPLMKHLSVGLEKYSLALLWKARGRRTTHKFLQEIVEAIPLYQEEKKREDARLAAAFLSIRGLFQERITDIFIPANKSTEIATHLGMDGLTPFTSEQFSLVIDGLVVAQSSTILGAASTWIEQLVLNIDAKLLMSKTMRLKVNELNAAQCAGLA